MAPRATDGTVTIEFEDAAHQGEAAYESAIIDDVAAGTYDLGWAAPRPWHATGVTTFDALMAPFLIDSYALQRAVLESELEQEMLAGLDGTGLVGLGILPGPLRRVATAEGGFRAADDLRGKLVGIQESEIAAMTFEALGASTKSLPSGGALGGADAVEQQLGSVVGNRYHQDLPHVTVDLALWPRPVILFANKARFDSLSAEQQTALRGVAEQLMALDHRSSRSRGRIGSGPLCADGADIVAAGDDAGAALLTAVRTVYDELEKDAGDGIDDPAHRRDEGRDPGRDFDDLVPQPIGLTGSADRRRLPGRHLRGATVVRRARGVLGGPSRAGG